MAQKPKHSSFEYAKTKAREERKAQTGLDARFTTRVVKSGKAYSRHGRGAQGWRAEL
jgi:hypothetical protein